MMLLYDALCPQDLPKESLLVDVAGDLPNLCLVLFSDQRAIRHVQVRQVRVMPGSTKLSCQLIARDNLRCLLSILQYILRFTLNSLALLLLGAMLQ